jgi:hypothetical protein
MRYGLAAASGSHLDMFEHCAVPQLARDARFQEDGARPHFGNTARQFLNERFTNKWIGNGGVLAWPSRSPDLTPLDFSARVM